MVNNSKKRTPWTYGLMILIILLLGSAQWSSVWAQGRGSGFHRSVPSHVNKRGMEPRFAREGQAELTQLLPNEAELEEIEEKKNSSIFNTDTTPILITTGFILAVLSLGLLLHCHPPGLAAGPETGYTQAYCRQVVYLVALFILLNLYDLACTLFASKCGGLWELNPFADSMLDVPFHVIVYKVAFTVGPAVLFYIARNYKLTQIATWWGGVLYTVLVLRWVTFNALFMG